MPQSTLENFYHSWSDKSDLQIKYDIACGEEKASVVIDSIIKHKNFHPKTIVEVGTGYGVVLANFCRIFKPTRAYGIDFSKKAIEFARSHFVNEFLRYETVDSLDVETIVKQIQGYIGHHVDCILLFDLLEHIPDCKKFIFALSKITDYFIIKLPLEKSFFDNVVLPKKEYPSIVHSNGHLREFDVNDVYYFVRQLGLIPIEEGLFIYRGLAASFPPQYNPTLRQNFFYYLLKFFKRVCSFVLPKKIFLHFVGGGGYYCFAKYSADQASIVE